MSRRKIRTVLENSRIHSPFLLGAASASAVLFLFFVMPVFAPISYEAALTGDDAQLAQLMDEEENVLQPIYLSTPEPLRAIYMTQCVVGTPSFREELVRLIEETELNAVVIDIKDYSGRIGFLTDNPALKESVSLTCRAHDMRDFIVRLHEKGIYVIARITVFQDPYYSKVHPELAIKKASATTTVWTDYKGLSFIDVGAVAFWDYIVELSKEARRLGFDELNFDYIRFPSDGNMKDIYYPYTKNRPRQVVLEEFFAYLSNKLKDSGAQAGGVSPVLSADLFGMTTTNTDDLNIGQVLERTFPYFDFISPMVYPSHYPPHFNGWANPNAVPYDIVRFSLDSAVRRARATTTTVETQTGKPMYKEELSFDENGATTTQRVFTGLYTKESYPASIIRPWLQDFDYGGNYDVAEVRAQIQATYDAGLDSWMIWSPSNIYTRGAFEAK
jgi:hypothetical protein